MAYPAGLSGVFSKSKSKYGEFFYTTRIKINCCVFFCFFCIVSAIALFCFALDLGAVVCFLMFFFFVDYFYLLPACYTIHTYIVSVQFGLISALYTLYSAAFFFFKVMLVFLFCFVLDIYGLYF